jgi:uncharacterized protein (DUF433 family)
MSLAERIAIDPEICHGKPTIRGLRYPVETILELLSSEMTSQQILADFGVRRHSCRAGFRSATDIAVVGTARP